MNRESFVRLLNSSLFRERAQSTHVFAKNVYGQYSHLRPCAKGGVEECPIAYSMRFEVIPPRDNAMPPNVLRTTEDMHKFFAQCRGVYIGDDVYREFIH